MANAARSGVANPKTAMGTAIMLYTTATEKFSKIRRFADVAVLTISGTPAKEGSAIPGPPLCGLHPAPLPGPKTHAPVPKHRIIQSIATINGRWPRAIISLR